jgi:hypothetical protein
MKLYAATHNGILCLATVRLTKKEAQSATLGRNSWQNCFDMVFTPTMKQLTKDGWAIECFELRRVKP